MKDAEQVYALYVQANPVPNPDLLPLTRDEAVLLSIEGSEEDMQTQEPTKKQPADRNTSRNVLVAVGAFAVVIVIGVVAALLINSGDSGPVAAADAAPVVVFDGSTCTYDGPTQIEEGTIEFTTTNLSDSPLELVGWQMSGSALAEELEGLPVGTDMAVTASDPMPEGELAMLWNVLPGDTRTRAWPYAQQGTYLIDCVTDDHVWRPAQIVIVVP